MAGPTLIPAGDFRTTYAEDTTVFPTRTGRNAMIAGCTPINLLGGPGSIDSTQATQLGLYQGTNSGTTQLTVAADEMAMFIKDGVVVGKLGPGRHTLDTNNVPFISSLLEKAGHMPSD